MFDIALHCRQEIISMVRGNEKRAMGRRRKGKKEEERK